MNTSAKPRSVPARACFGVALAALWLAGTAAAQTPGKPLNLTLPPSDLPAASASAATPSDQGRAPANAPGGYYGDMSGSTAAADVGMDDALSRCDDATYNQAQLHGSVSTGVVSGSRLGTGTWNAGTVHVSKAFGDCNHPTGGVSFSVSEGVGRFHGRGH